MARSRINKLETRILINTHERKRYPTRIKRSFKYPADPQSNGSHFDMQATDRFGPFGRNQTSAEHQVFFESS